MKTKTLEKPLWFTIITTLCLVVVFLFVIMGCDKSEEITIETKENWECVLEQFDVIITLTIDSTTDIVNVSKLPKEIGANDQFYQFRDGDRYFLQNDTLYLKTLDDNVCFRPDCAFAITRYSKDTMGLEYLGMLPDEIHYISTYLFNRITGE